MSREKKEIKRPNLRFNEAEIKLALSVLEQLEKPIDVMYYLMEYENENPFVLVLLSAKNVDLMNVLISEKRDTDLLYEVNKQKNLYAIICQETRVDGGYRFAERLLRTLILNDAESIYCTEVEVRSTRYDTKEVIFKCIESYIKAKIEKKEREIIFRSLY